MVELYVKLVIGKKRTIESVPKSLRADVTARLKELGYDENGNLIG